MSPSVTCPMTPMRITLSASLFRDPSITVPCRWYMPRTISFPESPSGTHMQTTVAESSAERANGARPIAFYSMRRRVASPAKPNPAHFALARLEDVLQDRLFVCTQNVDSLHEQAGSRNVIHMHGEPFKSRCD